MLQPGPNPIENPAMITSTLTSDSHAHCDVTGVTSLLHVNTQVTWRVRNDSYNTSCVIVVININLSTSQWHI